MSTSSWARERQREVTGLDTSLFICERFLQILRALPRPEELMALKETPAQMKFSIGQRVRQTHRWMDTNGELQKQGPERGVVIGFTNNPTSVLIQREQGKRDHVRQVDEWHIGFWEADVEQQDV